MSSMELNQLTYEAMYSYDASRPGDLGFSAGDELEVVGKQEGGWWKAVNKRTGQKGYIPQNFIQKKSRNICRRFIQARTQSPRTVRGDLRLLSK